MHIKQSLCAQHIMFYVRHSFLFIPYRNMKYGTLIIEERDFDLLKRIISLSHYYKDANSKLSLSRLAKELETVKVVKEADMPTDVVRFNSNVTIKLPNGEEKTYQIVTPEKSDIKVNKISILAPMAAGLFGYAVGDKILWHFPAGEKEIEVINVSS